LGRVYLGREVMQDMCLARRWGRCEKNRDAELELRYDLMKRSHGGGRGNMDDGGCDRLAGYCFAE